MKAFVADLDPSTPYYLTDSLSICSGDHSQALACTLLREQSATREGGCIVSPPAAPCLRSVLQADGVCHRTPDRPGGFGGGREYDAIPRPFGIIAACGQDGFIMSSGLLRSISTSDFAACEHCNTTAFKCYGGGDMRLGECFWAFGANGAGVGPTKPYGAKDVRVFGDASLGAIRDAARTVTSGVQCDPACLAILTRTLTTSLHTRGRSEEEYATQIREFYADYTAAKRILAESHHTVVGAEIVQQGGAANVKPVAPPASLRGNVPPLCANGLWTEVDPAAILNFSTLPGVACGRQQGVCVMQEYLTRARCSQRKADSDWPPLPAPAGAGAAPAQSVVTELMQQLRGTTVLFAGDSVTYNLWNFMVCELHRSGLTLFDIHSESRDATQRKVEKLPEPGRTRVRVFWERWHAAAWGAAGVPLGMDLDAEYVVETDTLLVRRLEFQFIEAEMTAKAALFDVMVWNLGLHYDLSSDAQRDKYRGHVRSLFVHLKHFANTPGKAVMYRETSRIHRVDLAGKQSMADVRAAGGSCACLAASLEPPLQAGKLEWSDELNGIARSEISGAGANVPVLPFYEATKALPHGHPQNFSASFNHGAYLDLCDCTHLCYSPALIRGVLADMLRLLPSTMLHARQSA